MLLKKLLLNELAGQVHAANAKWWVDPVTGAPIERDFEEMLALVHSEISEALEGLRKDLPDTHLPQYSMLQVELVDALIRLLDMAGVFEWDLNPLCEKAIPWIGTPSLDAIAADACQFIKAPTIHSDMPTSRALARIHKRISDLHQAYLDEQQARSLDQVTSSVISLFASILWAYHLFCPLGTMQTVYEAKMAYNAQRADHKLENRIKDGGKKF